MREPGDAESIESVRSISAKRGYALTAGVLLVMMLGGTLPVPLYVLWEKQMGFGPLGVTVVFAAYVVGTLAALLVLGDLSDHVGRRIVLAIAVACAAVSTALFLAATGIGLLIVARVVSGLAAGLATGTATCGNRTPPRALPNGSVFTWPASSTSMRSTFGGGVPWSTQA